MSDTYTYIAEARQAILAHTDIQPKLGLILGSGLGVLAEEMEETVVIPYEAIPHFPLSTVVGHAGKLIVGTFAGKPVAVMAGRFHLYEGHDPAIVTFPIRVLKAWGIETLFVTNAAGGIHLSYSPGDLMLIQDHINFMFRSPLMGPNDAKLGVRFPDMSAAYDPALRQLAHRVAQAQGISLREGVYVATLGPSFETPAEIRMFRQLGGDAVGMSTVPEVIVARHAGMRVLGISCISNMAAGILPQPLTHEEVLETGRQVKSKFIQLIKGIIAEVTF
jgi:purine-nucleoside phosphorylase